MRPTRTEHAESRPALHVPPRVPPSQYRPSARPTWESLVAVEPSLAQYERSARAAGENGAAWWVHWVRAYPLLRALVGPTSKHHETRSAAALEVVLDHLETVYRRAAR